MGDCVESCREVSEDEHTYVAWVGRDKEVFGYFDECSLCAMFGSESRFEGCIVHSAWLDMCWWSWAATTLSRILLRKGRLEIRWVVCMRLLLHFHISSISPVSTSANPSFNVRLEVKWMCVCWVKLNLVYLITWVRLHFDSGICYIILNYCVLIFL